LVKKYFADYIFTSPFSSPPFVKNGELIADETSGKILSVRKNSGRNQFVDKSTSGFKTLIIPGIINSHTHTDLTFKPDDKTPKIFSKWVASLTERRKSLDVAAKNRLRLKAFKDFIESGTTLIGDIIEQGSFYNTDDLLLKSKLIPKVKGFIEIRGIDPDYAPERISEFKVFYRRYVNTVKENGGYFSAGISPHSVYSVSEKLFKEIIKENLKIRLKMVVHASEHSAEAQFISDMGGDIAVNLLPAFKLSKFSKPSKTFSTPISYLNYLKILNKDVSIIHANEINDEDIEIIKNSGAGIIHCPRSNAFFNSKKLPLKKVLESGISVSIGTDSLYSNRSLSILDELRYAKKIHADVSSKDLFLMATVNGARALSFPNVTGMLKSACSCDFVVFKVGKNIEINEGNIYDTILSLKKTDIINVIINGRVIR